MVQRNSLENEIRSRVDAFVSELRGLVQQAALDSIRAAIAGAPAGASARRAAPRRATSTPAAPAPAGRRGRRPSPESERAAAALLAHVQAHPGQRLEEIGAALGMDTSLLKGPAARLVRDGSLRTEGQRRGTRYFPGSGRPARAANRAAKRAAKRGRKPGKAARKGRRRGGRR